MVDECHWAEDHLGGEFEELSGEALRDDEVLGIVVLDVSSMFKGERGVEGGEIASAVDGLEVVEVGVPEIGVGVVHGDGDAVAAVPEDEG